VASLFFSKFHDELQVSPFWAQNSAFVFLLFFLCLAPDFFFFLFFFSQKRFLSIFSARPGFFSLPFFLPPGGRNLPSTAVCPLPVSFSQFVFGSFFSSFPFRCPLPLKGWRDVLSLFDGGRRGSESHRPLFFFYPLPILNAGRFWSAPPFFFFPGRCGRTRFLRRTVDVQMPCGASIFF